MGFLTRTFYADGFEVFSLRYPNGETVELRLIGLEGTTPIVRWRHQNGTLRRFSLVDGGPLALPHVDGLPGRLAGTKFSSCSARVAVDVPRSVDIEVRDYRDVAATNACSDCGGLGWFLGETGHKFYIMRCDTCERFVDDHKAGLSALDSLEQMVKGAS